MKRKRGWQALWLAMIMVFAFVARAGYVSTLEPRAFWYDAQEYLRLARGMLGHGAYLNEAGEATAFWPPGYPAFLALLGARITLARLVQALLGAMTVLLVYGISRRILNRRASLLAAALCAVYPLYIYTAGTLYPVALQSFLLSAVFLLLLSSAEMGGWLRPFLAGALGAWAVLCSASVLPLMLASLPWLWVRARRHRRGALRPVLLFLLPMLLIVGGWTLRNAVHFHRPVIVSLNGGYNFWLGNYPGVKAATGNRWTKEMEAEYHALSQEHPGEAELDRALTRRAMEYVKADPGRFLTLSLSKAVNLWRLWPQPMTEDRPGLNSEKLVSILSYGLALPFALAFLFASLRRSPEAWLALLWFAAATAMHAVTLSKFRFRLPLDAVLLVFAAGGLAALSRRLGLRILEDRRA